MKPDFLGIGAQKCATGWLFRILNEHPEISMANTKEGRKDLQFFGDAYDRGFEWYERHFQPDDHQICGEFSTSYLHNKQAPERISSYNPDIKLIVSLRHPVERAFSNHKHEVMAGRVSGKNLVFEEGLKNNPMYLYQSCYYTHISEWFKYFSKDQFLIILVDDIKNNPSKVIESVYKFLEVDSLFKPTMLNKRVHSSKLPRSRNIESLKKWFYKVLQAFRLQFIIKSYKRIGAKTIIDKLNSKSIENKIQPMNGETRNKLLAYFKSENEKLASVLNLDLTHWMK